MAKAPFMPLYTSDYLGDTGHLSTEEHGAYLLILMQMWNAGGWLPSEPSKLARVARCSTKKWLGMADTVLAFFHIDGDRITNDRLTKERQKVEAKTEVRRSAGAMGGAAKALKNKKSTVANAIAKPCHSPEPEPDSKSDTSVSDGGTDLAQALDGYQALAKKLAAERGQAVWPVVTKFSDKRRARLKARIREHGLAAWGIVLRKAYASSFCTGSNDSGWCADFDFLTSPDGFLKTLEGKYDDRAIDSQRYNATRAAAKPTGPGQAGGAFDRVIASVHGALPERWEAGGDDPGAYEPPAIDGQFTVISAGDEPRAFAERGGSHQADAGSLFAKRRA